MLCGKRFAVRTHLRNYCASKAVGEEFEEVVDLLLGEAEDARDSAQAKRLRLSISLGSFDCVPRM